MNPTAIQKLGRRGASVGATVALLALALPPAASAAAADEAPRLRNTTCTYDQVIAAMKESNPTAAKRLERHERVAMHMRKFLELSPAARQAKIDAFEKKHPHALGVGRRWLRHHSHVRHAVRTSLETCGQY